MWLAINVIILLGLIFLVENWLNRFLCVVLIVIPVCLIKGWTLLDLWLAIIDSFEPVFKLFEGK